MEIVYAKNSAEWRAWLKENHKTATEIYLAYFRKDANKPSITYSESVDEAICFGWIDGIRKKIHPEEYIVRFTPRKEGSNWSLINTKKVEQMIAEKKMTKAGLEKVEQAKKAGLWENAYSLGAKQVLPEDFKIALTKNKTAHENFNKFSNTNQFSYIAHVNAVKNVEGRKERIRLIVSLLERNIKPHVDGKRAINVYKE